MNLINRTIVIILLLIALVGSCVSLFVVLFGRAAILTSVTPTLQAISDNSVNVTQLLCLGLAILVSAIAILLLYLELMPSGKMRMRLKSIQGAEVMMSAEAITTQLDYALDSLPGVIRVTPKVARGKGDALDVFAELTTTADVDIKKKTEEVMEVTRNVVEGGLGLRVGKVQIKIDQMKPPKKGSAYMMPVASTTKAAPAPDVPQIEAPRTDEEPKS